MFLEIDCTSKTGVNGVLSSLTPYLNTGPKRPETGLHSPAGISSSSTDLFTHFRLDCSMCILRKAGRGNLNLKRPIPDANSRGSSKLSQSEAGLTITTDEWAIAFYRQVDTCPSTLFYHYLNSEMTGGDYLFSFLYSGNIYTYIYTQIYTY